MTSSCGNGACGIQTSDLNRIAINNNPKGQYEAGTAEIIQCTTALTDQPNGTTANGSVSVVDRRLFAGEQQHQHDDINNWTTKHGISSNSSQQPANQTMCCLETTGMSSMPPTGCFSSSNMSNSEFLRTGHNPPLRDVQHRLGPVASSSASVNSSIQLSSSDPTAGTFTSEKELEIVEEDPYAELERILEKAQAEISEMFAQTVRHAVHSTSSDTLLIRKGESKIRPSGDTERTNLLPRGDSSVDPIHSQNQQHDHPHFFSQYVKYATIAHANATQCRQVSGAGGGTATVGRSRQPDHGHRLNGIISSTTGVSSGRSHSVGEAQPPSPCLMHVGSCGRSAKEYYDSLSDDLSLLDVGTTSAQEDSLEGAGEDTSDEREAVVLRRHQWHSVGRKSASVLRSVGAKCASGVVAGCTNLEQALPASDRITNSLPSVAGHRNLALHLKFKSHQSAIDAKRKQFFLTLDQEPFQPLNRSNMADLPSPSSTSLHSGHSHLIAEELGSKSSSAPVLLKDEENVLSLARANLRYSRSQSDRHLAEIEAIEACRWLRAAGFPQYAQMYEDHQFPIVVEDVVKDHPFLENDPLQSLFRRLHTLNRCANMHLDAHQHTPKPSHRDDSDDDSCALSEAWTFQHNSRRWSRVDDAIGLISVINTKQHQQHKKDRNTKGSGNEPSADPSAANGVQHRQQQPQRKHLLRAEDHEKLWLEGGGKITIGVPSDTDSQDDSIGSTTVHLRRTGSERLKDGAKAILRRVESIKSRRRKKQNRDGLIILAPSAGTSHLSPHRALDGSGTGFDIMSYSNPTSPRPSAEMLHFDDAIDEAGNRKNLFADDHGHSLQLPNVVASNAWDAQRYGDRALSPIAPGRVLSFRQQVQLQNEVRPGDDSSSICSEDSVSAGPGGEYAHPPVKTAGWKYARAKKALRSKAVTSTVADEPLGGALSDSEYHANQRRARIKVELDHDFQGKIAKDTVSTTTTSSIDKPIVNTSVKTSADSNTIPAPETNSAPSKLHRGGSLNLGKASKRYRDTFNNRSVRQSLKAGEDFEGRSTSKRPTVARWHSFQQPKVSPIGVSQQQQQQQQQQPDPLSLVITTVTGGSREDRKQQQQQQQQRSTTLVSNSNVSVKVHKTPGVAGLEGKHLYLEPAGESGSVSSVTSTGFGDRSSGVPWLADAAGLRISEMSCGQLLVVRKLGLANLTGYMERYCPTHRSGWNWDLPKFIKRIKTPDYKDRKVFGLPLVLNLQKYGSTVPYTIRMAFAWLERNALDQVGLFRKPGVKSRIAKLKSVIEAHNDVSFRSEMFDEFHAYDVADLLKQYFRDLPDPLLTAKLSETFVAIFQYLPKEVRVEAVQSAILLLPDEHREVLHLLLTFLDLVVQNSSQNQMTANNLAVCLAPSLFYLLSGNRYTAVSPRRKKTGTSSGTPDEREMSETMASNECLAFMIERFQSLWTITSDQMRRCNFNYLDESKPVLLASLGAEMHVQNWRGYLSESINECLREGRERPRGWVSLSSIDPSVTVFFKKVGDGHPLRLWKCVTEVEAPPVEVIQHIVNERSMWDAYLLKWRTIEQLDQDTDVFQYACGQPNTEYCVVRQWKNELPRGACVIVEVSISHENATSLLGGVNGVVLASRYLIEPCGSGKCKLMHLSRVDMKGRTPDWYNKNYGHICQQYLSKIKKFFEHCTEGPETKV